MELRLSEKEIVQLYAFIKPRELEINNILLGILKKIENILYSKFTIEEIEKLKG
ncbi:MAG: hypothetical protein J7K04_15810 [Spirochaetales bacterium]|nr:hypothetical protein [Spirochaetales bacterium]